MLRLNDIHAGYEGAAVLRGVSLTFGPGILTAVVGPNGGGKSTLLRVAAGLMKPTLGAVHWGERDLAMLPVAERARRLAFVSQRPVAPIDFSVREVVRLGRFAVARTSRDEHVDDALQSMKLLELAASAMGTLSVGQQQRVAVARGLAQLDGGAADHRPPSMLLADEPVAAMDPAQALSTMSVLKGLAARGHGVVVVLHDLSLAARFADRLVVLVGGSVLASGDTAEVLAADSLEQAFGTAFVRVVGGGRTIGVVAGTGADALGTHLAGFDYDSPP